MPMSDNDMSLNWQVWQPQNLLDNFSQPEQQISEIPGRYQSEESLQAELSHIRQLAEQKGFAQGQAHGVEVGKKEGFDAGFAEGKTAGYTQGLSESNAQQRETGERFSRLLEEFKIALDNLDSVIPSRLVQLSLTAARSMLGNNITFDNNALLEKIQQLLQQETLFKGMAQLWINPDDMVLVQEHVGQSLTKQGWELRADTNILPGGCRITSEEGEFDATLNTRWRELCELSREDYFA